MNLLSRRAVILGLPASLAACGNALSGGQPPPQLYQLTPVTEFAPGLPSTKAQLLIEVPATPGGLDTDRIALMRSALSLDYFANAAWSDRAPVMVQNLLIESFENTGKISAIGRQGLALHGDYVLQPELRDFTAVYTEGSGSPTVRVRIGLKLVRISSRIIVAQRAIESDEPAQQNSVTSVVAAFDAALKRAMTEIAAWTLPAIAGG